MTVVTFGVGVLVLKRVPDEGLGANLGSSRLFLIFGWQRMDEFAWSWVASQRHVFFFFATEFAKSNFLPCQLSMITDHAIHVRWRRREIRFNLFGTLSLKLLMPVDFAVSGYPWHWVETKWCWLATQDHAKPVSSYDCQWHLVDLFQAETLGYKANIVLT